MLIKIDPRIDFAFKRIFGSEEHVAILINLLNAVLGRRGAERICEVSILNPFSMKEALDDRLSILDIKARDASGREFIDEMQMHLHKAFRERLLYYLAKDYSQMLGEGEDFTQLRPVIVVCFIDEVLLPELQEFYSCYQFMDGETGVRFSDHWSVHVIELPKFKKSVTELADDLDRWTYFLKHGSTLDLDNMPTELETPAIRQATGVLTKMSHNTVEREQYEARLKYQRDQSCYIATAREEGREEGVKQGREDQSRDLIVRIGTKRLGPPSEAIAAKLQTFKNLDQLNSLADHVLDCPDWEGLVAKIVPDRTV